ncbi:MAG: hypothetical protein M3552_00920 [Planctomycetota bacterium]|nr:hypothetical protein [Planctomycetaceae bacterium]MDQ3329207.1 hypothetical protein [Planctomycetota bacterium]
MPSTRTPEGMPNYCPVCRNEVWVEHSWPTQDAPCPHCGVLLWFDDAAEGLEPGSVERQPVSGRPLRMRRKRRPLFSKLRGWMKRRRTRN